MNRIIFPLIAILLFAAPAFSQGLGVQPASSGGAINIGQAFSDILAPYINAAANALILALVGWVAVKFQKKTGIEIDKGHRDAITRALQNQAASLIAAGAVSISGAKISVKSDAMADAVNDLLKSVPDAIKHFGLTPDYVASRIIDTIPQISGTTTVSDPTSGKPMVAASAGQASGPAGPAR